MALAAAMMPLSSGYVPMHIVRPNAGAAVKMASLEEIKADSGALKPLGYWDPAGLMRNEKQIEENYKFYKEVEIKHGRVAMLATVGFLVAEQYHPLFGGTVDAPSAFAFQQTPLQEFWPFVVLVLAAFEVSTSVPTFVEPKNDDPSTLWQMKPDHIPGDLGFFGGTKLAKENPEGFKTIQTKEIQNGRLAMIGIVGMVCQELATGGKIF